MNERFREKLATVFKFYGQLFIDLTILLCSWTSLDSFKFHLKFWSSQEIEYDWRAEMAGTGVVSLNL